MRVSRKAGTHSRMRPFKVLVDGQLAGSIEEHQTKELPVSPGPHTVQIRLDWIGSRELLIEVGAGASCDLTCRANGSPVTLLFHSIAHRWDRIDVVAGKDALPVKINARRDLGIRLAVVLGSPFVVALIVASIGISLGLPSALTAWLSTGVVVAIWLSVYVVGLPDRWVKSSNSEHGKGAEEE